MCPSPLKSNQGICEVVSGFRPGKLSLEMYNDCQRKDKRKNTKHKFTTLCLSQQGSNDLFKQLLLHRLQRRNDHYNALPQPQNKILGVKSRRKVKFERCLRVWTMERWATKQNHECMASQTIIKERLCILASSRQLWTPTTFVGNANAVQPSKTTGKLELTGQVWLVSSETNY